MSLDACPSLQICFLVFQPTQCVFHVAFVFSFTFLPSNSLISCHGPHKTGFLSEIKYISITDYFFKCLYTIVLVMAMEIQ